MRKGGRGGKGMEGRERDEEGGTRRGLSPPVHPVLAKIEQSCNSWMNSYVCMWVPVLLKRGAC
jgi:hypothetical protein